MSRWNKVNNTEVKMARRRVPVGQFTSRTIRIDNEVYAWLQSKATPFKDGPNNVLRRMMEAERKKKGVVQNEDNRSVGHDLRTGS